VHLVGFIIRMLLTVVSFVTIGSGKVILSGQQLTQLLVSATTYSTHRLAVTVFTAKRNEVSFAGSVSCGGESNHFLY